MDRADPIDRGVGTDALTDGESAKTKERRPISETIMKDKEVPQLYQTALWNMLPVI